ncbi:MAG: FHA domain-containing protein [Lachnospiraceae bacterium]|jgi:pSer/pThr/pTyr-binding forkhead associated (FHA) protein|nr:FHA domain-containing protein [Lachnospiraceae bacterium]
MGLLRFLTMDISELANQQGGAKDIPEKEVESKAITTITGTKGQYENSIIEFDGSLTIGRDPNSADLIIDDNNVSRLHCTITYEPNDRTYIVTDHSTNGTFIGRERIEKGKSKLVPKGTFIIIGQSGNNFRLD